MDGSISDKRRPEPGSETQEKQMTALVASECLHGSIIYDFHRTPESGLKVETDPAFSEIMGFHDRPALENGPRVANGYYVVLPVRGDLLNSGNHLCRCHCWSGRERAVYASPSCEDFDGGTADIHSQDFHGGPRLAPRSGDRNLARGTRFLRTPGKKISSTSAPRRGAGGVRKAGAYKPNSPSQFTKSIGRSF